MLNLLEFISFNLEKHSKKCSVSTGIQYQIIFSEFSGDVHGRGAY